MSNRSLPAVLLLFFLSPVAHAVDGVIEINQTCAVNTGCFAGDAAGFPVMISASGSYRLTSNLATPSASVDGIDVTTDDVTVDLNGFEVAGPVVCTGLGSAVNWLGLGVGIDADGELRITVRDGRVRGFSVGLRTGGRAQVRNLLAQSNSLGGIETGAQAIVTGSTVHQNDSLGMTVGVGSTVQRSVASSNAGNGIAVGAGSTVLGNTAADNGANGLSGPNHPSGQAGQS